MTLVKVEQLKNRLLVTNPSSNPNDKKNQYNRLKLKPSQPIPISYICTGEDNMKWSHGLKTMGWKVGQPKSKLLTTTTSFRRTHLLGLVGMCVFRVLQMCVCERVFKCTVDWRGATIVLPSRPLLRQHRRPIALPPCGLCVCTNPFLRLLIGMWC